MTNLMHRTGDIGTRRALVVALAELAVVVCCFVATTVGDRPVHPTESRPPQATTDWISQVRG
jgi:hypothetical protein